MQILTKCVKARLLTCYHHPNPSMSVILRIIYMSFILRIILFFIYVYILKKKTTHTHSILGFEDKPKENKGTLFSMSICLTMSTIYNLNKFITPFNPISSWGGGNSTSFTEMVFLMKQVRLILYL